MITFRDVGHGFACADLLSRLARLAERGDALALLVEAGALEQAVLDALHPSRDEWCADARLLRRLTRSAADLLRAEWGCAAPPPTRLPALLDILAHLPLPARLRVIAPEGYSHYGIDPAAYAAAARRFADEVGRARAARAPVIGLRSIGTSLSAVVAAELDSRHSLTLRPRGASGQRHIAAGADLTAALRRWLRAAEDVLIVDEGPGATGETFHCTAQWLIGLGVASTRIALLPSHDYRQGGALALAPPERQAWFAATRCYPPPQTDARAERLAATLGLSAPLDLSGGRWRAYVPGAAMVPADPGHERLKYLARASDGTGRVLRYAGLGRWGEAVAARAERLAALGLGPGVAAASTGFVALHWSEGRPLLPAETQTRHFRRALARYLKARSGEFGTGSTVAHGPLCDLLAENAREALGEAPGLAIALDRLARLPETEAVIADARLRRWEWLRTAEDFLKVDALDHGDGPRFPGPVGAGWDLAAAAVEYRLSDGELAELVAACAAARREQPADIAAMVAAYRPAYAACALGEASLALWSAAEPERARLALQTRRYRAALAAELARV